MSDPQRMIPPPPRARAKEKLFRFLWKASGRRPSVDTFFTSLLKYRRYLPEVEARDCIPAFDESEVILRRCPVGAWSTPIIDVYVLIKAVIGFKSKRVLELGSYRGETSRLIAENTPDDVLLCTVDVNADHGSSYRNLPLAGRITRKVGKISSELFSAGEEYDFIFVDADHDYNSVMNDTMVALKVLSPTGVIFWHDYRFDGYFHGMTGIPEALRHFSGQHAIVAVQGTMLGMCSRCPGWETAKLIHPEGAGVPHKNNVWQDTKVRG